MPTDDLKLDADANDVVNELARARREMIGYNQSLADNAKVTATVTKQADHLIRSLVSIDQAGNRISVMQNHTTKGWETQKTAITQVVKAQTHLNDVTLSYGSALRLVGVQLAHRFIASSVSSIREAASEYTDIAVSLGEVRTISQDIPMVTSEWYKEARKLSEAYGKGVKDEIEATYQALSNQVVQSGDDLFFLAEANKFALTAVTDTSNAVNLLSSALNSYNVDITQTEEVSAKLFKTIELGRIRAAELANTFGSVALISKQTNIEMDELLAFMAALSKTGFKATEVMTQLRGIIVKILKPTKEMTKFFGELGVTTGEQALQVYGLVGFLEELRKSTNGSSTELGKMISRIRGLSAGLFGTTERGLSEISDALDQIRNSTDSYRKANDEMTKNLGTRTKIQLEKIKNTYLELAQVVVEAFTNTSEAIGGADAAVRILANTIAITLVASAARGVVALTQFTRAAIAARVAAFAGSGGAATVAIVAGAAAVAYLYERQYAAEEKAEAEAAERRRKTIFDINKAAQDAILAYDKTLQSNIRETEQYFAFLRKERAKDLGSLTQYYRESASNVKKYYSFLTSEAGDASKAIEKAYNRTVSDLEDIGKKRLSISRGLTEGLLGSAIDERTGGKRLGAYQTVIAQLQKAQTDAAKEGDKERFDYLTKRIKALFEEQSKYQDKLTSTNKKNEEKRAELDLQLAQARMEKQRALELAEFEKTSKAKATKRAEAESKYENEVLKIQTAQKKVVDIEFKRNDLIRERLKLEAQTLKNLDILEEKLQEQQKTQLAQKIEAEISTSKLKSGLATINKFKAEKFFGADAAGVKEALQSINEAYKDFVDGQEELGIKLTKADLISNKVAESTRILKQRQTNLEIEKEQEGYKDYAKTVTAAKKALEDFNAEQSRRLARRSLALDDLDKYMKGIKSSDVSTPYGPIATGDPFGNASPGYSTAQKVKERLAAAKTDKERVETAKELYKWILNSEQSEETRTNILPILLRIITETNKYVAEQNNLQVYKNKLLSAEEELQKKLLEIEKKRAQLQRTGNVDDEGPIRPGNYTGSVYGRDNMNTNIAKGESIISAYATRRAYNQLVAINTIPQAAVSGKTVNVGDINVNLNSTGSAKIDARAIALEIKGLVKRGVVA